MHLAPLLVTNSVVLISLPLIITTAGRISDAGILYLFIIVKLLQSSGAYFAPVKRPRLSADLFCLLMPVGACFIVSGFLLRLKPWLMYICHGKTAGALMSEKRVDGQQQAHILRPHVFLVPVH